MEKLCWRACRRHPVIFIKSQRSTERFIFAYRRYSRTACVTCYINVTGVTASSSNLYRYLVTCAMRLSVVFQKKLYVRRIVRNSRGLRDSLSRSRAWRGRGTATGRNPREAEETGCAKGTMREKGWEGTMRGYMGCRRIVASVLRVLIWRHSARQFHLVLRGFSSSRPGHASHQDLISNHPDRSR